MSQTASASVTGDQGAIAIVPVFQDAIILGGTGSNAAQDSVFGGYGTVIERCIFTGIRRAVLLRAACNSVVVRDNVISFKCGGGIDEAAVDIDGSVGITNGSNVVSGNHIEGNDIEITFYVNGVRMNNTISNTAVGNYIADNNIIIENVAGNRPYLFTSTASNNLVVGGFAPRYPTDATPIGSNTVIVPSDSTTPIIIGNPVQFGSSASVGFFGGSPIAKPTVTGSKGGNAALASLLSALASFGLLTDSST